MKHCRNNMLLQSRDEQTVAITHFYIKTYTRIALYGEDAVLS